MSSFFRVEDILIFDNNLATRLNRVFEVLERCLTDGITLNKFVFTVPEADQISYCGYKITVGGYTINKR